MITGFYHMVPPPSSSGDTSSRDYPPYLSLTDALRMSISGEAMELGEEVALGGEPPSGQTDSLAVPEAMPVDLRVKLALAMINLGRQLPEVRSR